MTRLDPYAAVLAAVLLSGCYARLMELPPGVSYVGAEHPTDHVEFLADLTFTDPDGNRHVDQEIFDAVLEIIHGAAHAIVVDMFLFNDFQGSTPETTRLLAGELTGALIARKQAQPELNVVVISDPVNTVYGGIESKHFSALQAAGITVVITRLDKLRDSNPLYSGVWRVAFGWLGNSNDTGVLPSPFSDDRVTLRSYLALLNFKANHRKTIVADDGNGGVVGLVTSANPHDASSAHGNVALRFDGPSVTDLLATERAVVEFSEVTAPDIRLESPPGVGAATIQVVTEGKILNVLLELIGRATSGDSIDVAVFYLSDLEVIAALADAQNRGAKIRVLLDPNKNAFGFEKNGIPNLASGGQLHRDGVPVRWCDTHGEQCHAKMILVRHADESAVLVLGSANFTRRNLRDYNLETSLVVRGDTKTSAIRDASAYFELVWNNDETRHFSVDYAHYADESIWKRFRYWITERTGFASF